MIRIVEENLESCINFIESGEKRRWYVIKEPICEGFCKGPFYTKADAEKCMKEMMQESQLA